MIGKDLLKIGQAVAWTIHLRNTSSGNHQVEEAGRQDRLLKGQGQPKTTQQG